jgi:hypothetical protein
MTLQPVENRVSPYREFLSARLAYQILDALVLSMMAISHQRMDTFIQDVEVDALTIVAGISMGRKALFATSPISYFTPRRRRLASLGFFGWRSLFFTAYGAIIRGFRL